MKFLKTVKLSSLAIAVITLWTGWTALILVVTKWQSSPFVDAQSRFALTGTFGDSFGGFSALMSALAFVGVVFGLEHSQDSEARQSFDSSFFTLLSHFQDVVASIDVHQTDAIFDPQRAEPPVKFAQGRDALRFMLELFYVDLQPSYFGDSKCIFRLYSSFFQKWEDDLGHYFRILYHIVRLIDERCPGDKEHYSRVLRAHLSQSELKLLAYNSVVGEGREKFYLYVERYSLLHNLALGTDDFTKAERRLFERRLAPNAFRTSPPLPFEY